MAPSRRLEKVEETASLMPFVMVEDTDAGKTLLYTQSKRKVSNTSRTMSMVAGIGDVSICCSQVDVWRC